MEVDQELEQLTLGVTQAFRELLESKHLYQSVTCPSAPERRKIRIQPVAGGPAIETEGPDLRSIVEGSWFLASPTMVERVSRHVEDRRLRVRPPDVKLFCRTPCDRLEPFNLVSADDLLTADDRGANPHETLQMFGLSFRCQSCKGVPEVFLVRRQGLRLTLSGRSLMEHVAVPAVIPKVVKSFYRGAIIAQQSGQTLAGVFMLRTLIEQWARAATARTDYADQVLDAYAQTLPPDFRARFPVLRDTYSRLSAEVHTAQATEATFESARAEIVEHFDARRLFRL